MTEKTATSRRLRQGFLTAALLLATTASAVLATMIAQKKAVRIDVTQTRMHRLAERTVSLLDGLDGQYEVVLAFNARATNQFGQPRVDRRARERTDDVLQEMKRQHPELLITSIDTGSTEGASEFEDLLRRLLDRESEQIDAHASAVETAADELARLAGQMSGSLSTAVTQLAASIDVVDATSQAVRGGVEDRSQLLRRLGTEMARDAADAKTQLTPPPAGLWLPESDELAESLPRSLRTTAANLDALAQEMSRLAADNSGMSEATRTAARSLARLLESARDEAMVQTDIIERLAPLDLHRIRKALTSGEVALVIGPIDKGVTAVDFDALFPASDVIDATTGLQADLRRRAEELIASALGSISSTARPIVIIAHAEPGRGLGNPEMFGAAAARLQLRGMDVIEWPISLEPTPPNLIAIDPDGVRPVVWVFHDTDSHLSDAGSAQLTGPAKAEALGRAMRQAVDRGDAILISTNPSVLPGYGQLDPTVAVLSDFGLEAQSGRALVREVHSGVQTTVTPEFRIQIDDSNHPISGAVSGLPLWMGWPVAIGPKADSGDKTQWWPLATIEASGSQDRIWGESGWLAMRRVPSNQRHLMTSPPTFDPGRDDEAGRWVVAEAAERTSPTGPQRMVYVGSNGWFVGNVISASQTVDGRVAPIYPGNIELLESSIYWLAGQDQMIARSATAQATPLVSMLSGGQLRVINIVLIGVLPGLVLALGVVWRVVRG